MSGPHILLDWLDFWAICCWLVMVSVMRLGLVGGGSTRTGFGKLGWGEGGGGCVWSGVVAEWWGWDWMRGAGRWGERGGRGRVGECFYFWGVMGGGGG